jgi:uncharacterized protein (TIGR00369 family)
VQQGELPLRESAAVEPTDPGYADRVRESFARQRFMDTIGARLTRVEPGGVDVEFSVAAQLGQQHGFVHVGVITAATDTACGYAALTLMDADAAVLSVEFKINLLQAAEGERIVARGRVVRAGRTITVCRGEALAVTGAEERHVATMTATMMAVRGRGISG